MNGIFATQRSVTAMKKILMEASGRFILTQKRLRKKLTKLTSEINEFKVQIES